MKNHLSKKKECKDILACGLSANKLLNNYIEFKCNLCNKSCDSLKDKLYHEINCKLEIENIKLSVEITKLKEKFQDISKNHDIQNQNIEIKNEIQNQNIEIKNDIQNQNIEIKNEINNQNIEITNQNITINVMGNENISFITSEFMNECIYNKFDGLIQFLEMKHFNPNTPENSNIIPDGENYKILDHPYMTGPRCNIRIPYNGNFWFQRCKYRAFSEHILPRAETAFRTHIETSSIPQQTIIPFIQDVVLPLEWTMGLQKIEDEQEEKMKDILDDIDTVKSHKYKKLDEGLQKAYKKSLLYIK